MWTLVIPLLLPAFGDEADRRIEHRVSYASYQQCEAARLDLVRQIETARGRRYDGDPWLDAALRNTALAEIDQPPGFTDGWEYIEAGVGHCISASESGPAEPLARSENVTG